MLEEANHYLTETFNGRRGSFWSKSAPIKMDEGLYIPWNIQILKWNVPDIYDLWNRHLNRAHKNRCQGCVWPERSRWWKGGGSQNLSHLGRNHVISLLKRDLDRAKKTVTTKNRERHTCFEKSRYKKWEHVGRSDLWQTRWNRFVPVAVQKHYLGLANRTDQRYLWPEMFRS